MAVGPQGRPRGAALSATRALDDLRASVGPRRSSRCVAAEIARLEALVWLSARVAIIGSGFGGLAAAIRLQAAGAAHGAVRGARPPGRPRLRLRGPGLHLRRRAHRDHRARTASRSCSRWRASDCADHVTLDAGAAVLPAALGGRHALRLRRHARTMRAQIAALAPGDAAGYERFLDYSRRVFEAGYEELVDAPFLRFADMVRVAPQLARLRADRSVYGAVAGFVKDERLRQALSFHALLIGGNPFETSAIYTLIPYLERKWGVFFPRGGTGALVQALVGALPAPRRRAAPRRARSRRRPPRRRGADRPPRAPDRAATREPSTSSSPTPICTTPTRGSTRATPRRTRRRARLERMHWSMSLFVLYFGTRRKYPGMRPPHRAVRSALPRAAARDLPRPGAAADDFSLYLHAPTVTDPSLAPPGCEAFYVLAPVPHLGAAAIDWEARGAEPTPTASWPRSRRVLPDLRRQIVVKRVVHAARLPRSAERVPGLGVLAGAAPRAERLVSPAQPRSATSPASTSSARAPTRARACPA